MILRISSCFLHILLVSTNTGFSVISAQRYPIYQQNSYGNPSANQQSDYGPYLQSTTAQNQSPPLNLSPSNIRQILLNRILSSPSMQTVLDSNLRDYGSNWAEFNNNPIATNPVTNYFVAPTNKEDKVAHIETEEKPKKNRRRSSKSRRKHNGGEKNDNNSSKNVRPNDRNTHNTDSNRETNKKSRKRSRKQNAEATSQDNETKNDGNDGTRNTRTKKRKNKDNRQSKDNPIEEMKDENPKPRRRHKKKLKSDKDNLENGISEQDTPNTVVKETKDEINLAYFNEGIIEENRVPRTPKNDGKDLLNLFPNMPENIGSNFMKEMTQFDHNPIMSNFLANYENMYQSLSNDKMEKKRRKPTRSRKHHRRRNRQKKKNSTGATVSTNSNIPKVNPKIDIVTTERTIYINEKKRANTDPIPKDEGLKSFDAPVDMEKGKMKVFGNEKVEVGCYETTTQDSDPNINDLNPKINENLKNDHEYLSNEYIDDYYPLFTDSAAYDANKREVFIKNLSDTKYYYATDKGNTDSISPRKFELPEHVVKDYERNKQYGDIEKESIKSTHKTDVVDKIKEDKTKFRSPPLLEVPDFQTRKIERSEIYPEPYYHFDDTDMNHRFVEDKSSSYSEAKIPYYAETKHNGIQPSKDKLQKDVETVFAKSKVVNYGPVYTPDEDSFLAGTNTQTWTDETYFKNGGTSYVFAKSMDNPESFW